MYHIFHCQEMSSTYWVQVPAVAVHKSRLYTSEGVVRVMLFGSNIHKPRKVLLNFEQRTTHWQIYTESGVNGQSSRVNKFASGSFRKFEFLVKKHRLPCSWVLYIIDVLYILMATGDNTINYVKAIEVKTSLSLKNLSTYFLQHFCLFNKKILHFSKAH